MLGNITGDYPIQPAQFSITQFKLDCAIVINQLAGDSSSLSASYFKLSQMASWSIIDSISIANLALELTIKADAAAVWNVGPSTNRLVVGQLSLKVNVSAIDSDTPLIKIVPSRPRVESCL
jgi:hypothetical protein